MNKILVVAAHPDDEILGSGATVARLVKDGAESVSLVIGTGRDGFDVDNYRCGEQANKLIGSHFICPMNPIPPDNKFDSVPLMDFVQFIEQEIEVYRPYTIFTHFRNDLNIDHRITYQAVITATRPMKDCPVKEIYSFEIPSSTEWNYPTSLSPNVFFDITDTIHLKLKAMEQYESELREWPHPRSLAGIRTLAEYRGMSVGMQCAEAFEAVRVLR